MAVVSVSKSYNALANIPTSLRFHMLFQPIAIANFLVRLLGLIFLSILLVTVIVSPNVHRHILLSNFVCIHALHAYIMIFLLCVVYHLSIPSLP